MKVIIAGSRDLTVIGGLIQDALEDAGWEPTEVVSGGARGIDRCGETYAWALGLKCRKFPAEWDRFGRAAGHRRNAEMTAYADALLAIWDGNSRGTQNMIDQMIKLGKPVHVRLVGA